MSDSSKKSTAVFLDRDGVINVDHGYVHRIEEFEYLPRVKDALALIKSKGYLTVLVTNQSGIARGFYQVADYERLTDWMQDDLKKLNIAFDGIYYCPHHPNGVGEYAVSCTCRKPGIEMFKRASADLNIDLTSSVMVGDRLSDIQAGINASCAQCYLVSTGKPLPEDTEQYAQIIRTDLWQVATELPSLI